MSIISNIFSRRKERDFEGRCSNCRRGLKLIISRINIHEIRIRLEPCPEHPEESYILWPQRADIVIEDRREKGRVKECRNVFIGMM